MIEEVFISSNNKVLLGDINLYPQSPDYPSHVIGNKQLTQLNINDITLGILYSNLDTFTILSYLEIIKKNLEAQFYNVTSKTILDNYFQVRETISTSIPQEKHYKSALPVLSSSEVFIDIIETYNIIIDKEFSICDVYGYCFIKPRFNEENFLKLIIKKDNSIKYISNYKIVERFNKLEMELNVSNKDMQILKYKTTGKLPFKIEANDDGYVLNTENFYFDSLDIHIPCKAETKSINLEPSKGSAKFIDDKVEINWSFKKQKVGRAFLKIQAENFKMNTSDSYADQRPIHINFKISKTDKNILNIEKAICLDNPEVDIWVRYDICNGNVEVRK